MPSATEEHPPSRTAGALAASGAFFLWGVLPFYWKLLRDVGPVEVIAHRVLWSLLFLLVVQRWRGRIDHYVAAIRAPRLVGPYVPSGLLLAANWLTFVYAVQSDQIVEASLGYFLVPICNVAIGFVVLRERLRPVQWLAVAFAAAGVVVQLIRIGRLPWLALVLAITFAFYGLLRKRGPLGSMTGLAVETTLMAPIAIAFLAWQASAGTGALGVVGPGEHMLLIGCGVITAVPLLLFATGARALTLATLGLFQYIGPSLQLLVGVGFYGEPFAGPQVTSFALIWVGLAVYSFDGFVHGRRLTANLAKVAASV